MFVGTGLSRSRSVVLIFDDKQSGAVRLPLTLENGALGREKVACTLPSLVRQLPTVPTAMPRKERPNGSSHLRGLTWLNAGWVPSAATTCLNQVLARYLRAMIDDEAFVFPGVFDRLERTVFVVLAEQPQVRAIVKLLLQDTRVLPSINSS